MRATSFLAVCSVLVVGACAAYGDTTSYTGTLGSPETDAEFEFTLATAGLVTLQTYSFGGGTNAAGTLISPGGTDPFLAIFSGSGDSASIVTDGLGNPYGTSLDLTNYGNPDFVGCPPAGQPVIGGLPQCGDITMSVSLDPGTYTVVLSDGQYIANAVFDDGTLGEGFSDLTGGAFCNLSINGVDCPNTSGAYALDITTPGSTSAVPEPAGSALAVTVLFGMAWFYRRKRTASSAPQQ